MNKKTVVVAMSGGVDSSVVALILKNQGYNVIGLHMSNGNEDEQDFINICKRLNIEYHIEKYDNQMALVKDYFINSYINGKTPNPCVICNKEVKFTPFLDFVNKTGADYLATGHYANIEQIDGKILLCKAKDDLKDQTYFLNQLKQNQLVKVLFPLGNLTKEDIRKIAQDNNFENAQKKDSFDVCFVGGQKFKHFMQKNYPDKQGDIVNVDNNKIVGKHSGLSQFTVGQRKGLGIGGQKDILGKWFVFKKDLKNNILYVSTDEQKLMSSGLIAKNINFINPIEQKTFDCNAKIRYRQQDQQVTVDVLDDDKIKVSFKTPQRAIAIGQFVVFYKDNICLGGAEIDEVL